MPLPCHRHAIAMPFRTERKGAWGISCMMAFSQKLTLSIAVQHREQVYFLRSMAVLIQAGPGGGVDVPAVKAVLHAQGLERYARF